MKEHGIVLLVVGLLAVLVVELLKPEYPKKVDQCYSCHQFTVLEGRSHDLETLGCAICHLGNPYALRKEAAHFGMVKNPADLRFAERTCGQSGCHPDQVKGLNGSVMASSAGILHKMRLVWQRLGFEGSSWPEDITKVMAGEGDGILFLDYFRKMCAGCHLWREGSKEKGEVGERGGGCSACHVLREEGSREFGTKEFFKHSTITTKIPSSNCIRCHNRSSRVGLSYKGQYESEGYGTPYEGDGFSRRRLSGNRFYMELPSDIHHRKAGMECIDCHNAQELMGDGNKYKLLKEQLDTECEVCHRPYKLGERDEGILKEGPIDERAERLLRANGKIEVKEGQLIRYSKKGYPLYNVVLLEDGYYLFRKMDGFPFRITPMKEAPYHTLPGHKRLSCQSCHSQWMPQCYGCHIGQSEGYQWDWVKGKGSGPVWKERRDFMRFESPPLGIKDNKIWPISPHYVFFYEKGGDRPRYYYGTASFDPHTTQRASRDCKECHRNLRTYGKGTFYPGMDSFLGRTGLDSKAFEENELEGILKVGMCIGCHREYSDRIYIAFDESYKRFVEDNSLPCRR